MNLIFVLAMIAPSGMTPLAQFNDREACMVEARKMTEQSVHAVCIPKQVKTEKEVAAELNKALGMMNAFISAMQN
jgi:hypothetical protein